jgi:hypothetical protein
MTTGADVRAITALEDWHNALCVYRTEAMESLSAIALEIRRAYDWIDGEAQSWKSESREAEEEVYRAKVELARRETPDFNGRIPDTTVQEENLARAKARYGFAEDQIEVCKSWSRKLPKLIGESYESQARRLGNFLEIELASAIAQLNNQINSLHAYAAIKPVEVAKPSLPGDSL